MTQTVFDRCLGYLVLNDGETWSADALIFSSDFPYKYADWNPEKCKIKKS